MTSKRTNASFFTVVILQRNPVRSACFVVLVQKHCWALISQLPWVVVSLKQLLHHVASNAKSCIIFTIMMASGGGFSQFTFVLLLSSVNQKQRCAEKCLTTGPLVVGKWERYYLFSSDSVLKNSPANAGDTRVVGLIPGSGRSPGEGHGNPLQYSCLENPMDRGTWRATVHGFAKSQTWLSNWALPQSHLTHHWLISSYQHDTTECRFGKSKLSLRRQYKSSLGHCWSGMMIRAMQSVPLVQLKCCCAVIFHFILNALPPTIPDRIE